MKGQFKIGNVTISKTAWYHEYPNSIELYVQCRTDSTGKANEKGIYDATLILRIPASKLEKSLRRMKRRKR